MISAELQIGPPPIEGDRKHDDGARDYLLNPVRYSLLRTSDLDHGHDPGSGKGADDASFAPGETTTPDDDCRDDVQLEAYRDRRVAHRQPREFHHAGQTG